jgi:hypothetical protein
MPGAVQLSRSENANDPLMPEQNIAFPDTNVGDEGSVTIL